jgi:hypothetical protein
VTPALMASPELQRAKALLWFSGQRRRSDFLSFSDEESLQTKTTRNGHRCGLRFMEKEQLGMVAAVSTSNLLISRVHASAQ